MIKTQCVVVRGNLNALRYSNEIFTPVCMPHLQNNGRMKLMHDGNREADQRLCFRYIVQSLYYLNPKSQVTSHLLWLYSPVCVGPGRKPRRPVFSQRGSIHLGGSELSFHTPRLDAQVLDKLLLSHLVGRRIKFASRFQEFC